mmetsp:Transcript_3555/g.5239  ORF Transcript_3555/g.5239 Transcript_3555/m.5239 type:complete len:88 (-) Transcript_3555:57-320(-)
MLSRLGLMGPCSDSPNKRCCGPRGDQIDFPSTPMMETIAKTSTDGIMVSVQSCSFHYILHFGYGSNWFWFRLYLSDPLLNFVIERDG